LFFEGRMAREWLLGQGRIGRPGYLIAMTALLLLGWLAHPAAVAFAQASGALPTAVVAMLGTQFVVFWLTLSLGARRLHDLGRSAWWQMAPLAVGVSGVALAQPASAQGLGLSETASMAAAVGGAAVYFLFVVVLGCIPGRPREAA
jgi:uncharacterized membrane protein YhaH (DUF805 family)